MHKEVLSSSQAGLLPLLGRFAADFGLAGGTAVALHLGHRRSLDFYLFTPASLDHDRIRSQIRQSHRIEEVLITESEELTLVVAGVKMTFGRYPFPVSYNRDFAGVIKLPDALSLAAMKAFALGKRSKWKDYVDLYFLFKKFRLSRVVQKAAGLFRAEFNEKLFREQLSYFEDIDYSETVDFLEGFKVAPAVVKKALTEVSLEE